MHLYTAREIVAQLATLQHLDLGRPLTLPMGMELEGWVYRDDGLGSAPVDLTRYDALLRAVPSVYDCGTDLGRNMFEIAFNPETTLHGYVDDLMRAFAFLADHPISTDWLFSFEPNAGPTCGTVTRSRYEALVEAVDRERPGRGYGDLVRHTMIRYAAFQINIGVGQFAGGIFSEEAARLLYAFNNWAPALQRLFEHHHNTERSDRLSKGYAFAHPHRAMRYLREGEIRDLASTLLQIPQLIIDVDPQRDVWVPYLEPPVRLNAAHTGTIWWPARVQGIDDRKAERIEIRSLNAVNPAASVEIAYVIDRIVAHILDRRFSALPRLDAVSWHRMRTSRNHTLELQNARTFLEQLGDRAIL